jgi:hypothetical protein
VTPRLVLFQNRFHKVFGHMSKPFDLSELDHCEPMLLVERVVVQVSHGPIGVLWSIELNEKISVGA